MRINEPVAVHEDAPFVPDQQSPSNFRVVTTSITRPAERLGLRGRDKRCIVFVTIEDGPLKEATDGLFQAMLRSDHETFTAVYQRAYGLVAEAAARRTRELLGVKGSFHFDRFAFCSCPCSPGVVFKPAVAEDVRRLMGWHFNVTVSVPRLAVIAAQETETAGTAAT